MSFSNLKRLGFVVRRYHDNQLNLNSNHVKLLSNNEDESDDTQNNKQEELKLERLWWDPVAPIQIRPVPVYRKYSKDSFYTSSVRSQEQYSENYKDLYCVYKPCSKFSKRNPGTPDFHLKCITSTLWKPSELFSILDQPNNDGESKNNSPNVILGCCDDSFHFAYFSVSPTITTTSHTKKNLQACTEQS